MPGNISKILEVNNLVDRIKTVVWDGEIHNTELFVFEDNWSFYIVL